MRAVWVARRLRRDLLEPGDASHCPQLVFLVIVEAQNQRLGRLVEAFQFGTAELEGRRRLCLDALLLRRLRRLRESELAQLGFNRRPHPLLTWREVQTLLDARDLGVVEQRVGPRTAGRRRGWFALRPVRPKGLAQRHLYGPVAQPGRARRHR